MRKHRFYLSITAVPALAGIALQQPATTTVAASDTAAHAPAVPQSLLAVGSAATRPAPPAPTGSFGSSAVLTSFDAPATIVADLAVADGPSVTATVATSSAALPYSTSAPPTAAVAREVDRTPAPAAPSPGVWAELRQCESGGNYRDATGNGYYGAYQFSVATWHSLGEPGLPSEASPAAQDDAARRLEARSGWGQWPACSRRLGL